MDLSIPGITKITEAIVPLLNRMQVFVTNGNFTALKTGDYFVIAVGGGGGGGSGGGKNTATSHGGMGGHGGLGGSLQMSVVSLTAGQVVPITIGAGGVGGTRVTDGQNGNPGQTGGNTEFGTFVFALGGSGGFGGGCSLIATGVGYSGSNGGGFGGGVAGNYVAAPNDGSYGQEASSFGGGGGGGGGCSATGTYSGPGGHGYLGILAVIW